MFKEIPSTLEYVDDNKLFLRRTSRLYGGYYFDFDSSNDQIDIYKPGDTTDQSTFTSSVEKNKRFDD